MTSLFVRYLGEKLRQPSTYILPLVVGTLINSYGQFLIPFLRGDGDPWIRFVGEWRTNSELLMLSIFLGYCFPFLVALYSAVLTRIGAREIEEKAMFPDNKPDPVFCVDEAGRFIAFGNKTRSFIARHGYRDVKDFIGIELWLDILTDVRGNLTHSFTPIFHCRTSDRIFHVRYSKNPEGNINLYLSDLSNVIDML